MGAIVLIYQYPFQGEEWIFLHGVEIGMDATSWLLWGYIGMAVVPLIMIKHGGTKSLLTLFGGVVLITLSITFVEVLGAWDTIIGFMLNRGDMSKAEYETALQSLKIWKAVYPIVTGGLGVNALSAWLHG